MEVKGVDYLVSGDLNAATITFQGLLRLRELAAYKPITDLLNQVLDQNPETITLNLRELTFLNSAGIDMLLKFAIKVRNLKTSQLVILASSQNPWQSKSLKNMERLMPEVKIEFE